MILFESEISFHLTTKRIFKYWINALITKEGKKPGDIHYLFCSDEYLLSINQKYLDHDTYTDIITFDYSEENTISGDIFISIDRVKENAPKYEVTFQEELVRVMAHGIFHLLGFGDHSESEKKIMRNKENEAIQLYDLLKGEMHNTKKAK